MGSKRAALVVVVLLAFGGRTAAEVPARKPAAGSGEPVSYRSSVPLAAVFLKPAGPEPWPAAVIVHGSGASDRTNVWARAVAEVFVERGVAVLLTDKRGSGQSGGDWQTVGFEELASDAIAGVDYLKTRPDVDGRRIGLLGLSQGGWIVPLAAVRDADVAFVVNVSGATVSYAEQTMAEMQNTARQAGLTGAAVQEIVELNKAAGRYLLGGSWPEYAAMRERALAGPARRVAAGFPGTADAPVWQFLKKVGPYDPAPYWSVIAQPVLIAYGEKDEEDNVPVEESVRRARFIFEQTGKTNYRIVVVPAAGHALWNEKREFPAVLTSAVADWLEQYVLPSRPPGSALQEQHQEQRGSQ